MLSKSYFYAFPLSYCFNVKIKLFGLYYSLNFIHQFKKYSFLCRFSISAKVSSGLFTAWNADNSDFKKKLGSTNKHNTLVFSASAFLKIGGSSLFSIKSEARKSVDTKSIAMLASSNAFLSLLSSVVQHEFSCQTILQNLLYTFQHTQMGHQSIVEYFISMRIADKYFLLIFMHNNLLFSVSFFRSCIEGIITFLSSSITSSSTYDTGLSTISNFVIPLIKLSSRCSILFLLRMSVVIFESSICLGKCLIWLLCRFKIFNFGSLNKAPCNTFKLLKAKSKVRSF